MRIITGFLHKVFIIFNQLYFKSFLYLGTLVSTWLLAFAYKNTKHVLKHKLANKREAAVAKELNAKVADDKKISKKEKDERILWKKNEVWLFKTRYKHSQDLRSYPIKVSEILRYTHTHRQIDRQISFYFIIRIIC